MTPAVSATLAALPPLTLPTPAGPVTGWAWAAPGLPAAAPAPLLVAHDGADYATRAALPVALTRAVEDGRLPPHRAAFLAPGGAPGDPAGTRDERYSAAPAYARALAGTVLPALTAALPVPAGSPVVGLGASLGALAMLHAWRAGAPLGGLVLQSGSFFQPDLDPQESWFPRFARVTGFVAGLLDGAPGPAGTPPVPVLLTCGAGEENLANNRAMAAALRRRGHPLTFAVNPGGHDWPAWAGTVEPHLVPFLAGLWGTSPGETAGA